MLPVHTLTDYPPPNDDRKREKSRYSFARLSKFLTDPNLPLTSSQRLIALIIFQHVNIRTLRCFPSVNTICRRGKVSKNTVANAIKILCKLGLMAVNKKRDSGQYARNEYDFSPLARKLDQVPKEVSGTVA